jgi:hypothetical protein
MMGRYPAEQLSAALVRSEMYPDSNIDADALDAMDVFSDDIPEMFEVQGRSDVRCSSQLHQSQTYPVLNSYRKTQ